VITILETMSAKPELTAADLQTSVRRAMDLLSRGQSGLARTQAEAILRHYPDEVNSLFVVAVAIRDQGDNEKALKRLQSLIRRAPDFVLAQQELGFAYAEAGRLPEAITALKRAVAIEPKLPGPRRGREAARGNHSAETCRGHRTELACQLEIHG
jgi:tetratricopeptide (TPR) repeat protein